MQSRGTKGLLSSLRINYADYVGFPPELLALVHKPFSNRGNTDNSDFFEKSGEKM